MATLTKPDAVAMDSQKLEQVNQLFQQQIDEGLHPGAGLAVYRYGNLVLDIYGGIANTEPVASDTMFVLMSSTKPLTASCMYMLEERGQIAWDDLVSKHWPEFAQNGKETVTIRHILTHRGGFPQTPESLPWTDWADWSKVTHAMEQAPTIYTPGETLAYHPINYGWVLAEIVRRVDGRTFDRFIAEELAAPLGIDNTYVGLPAGLESRVSPMHLMEDDADTSGYSGTFSRPEVWRCIVPGANGVATASDLARFYAMMERKGSLDGKTVVQSATVEGAVELQVEGTDQSLGLFAQRSLGLALAEVDRKPAEYLWPRRGRNVHWMGRLRLGPGRGVHHQRIPRQPHQQRPTGCHLPSRPRRLHITVSPDTPILQLAESRSPAQ